MLSRIPAVKWAFTRLRPSPSSGSIDAAPIVADEQPAIVAEAAPALDSVTEPTPRDADIEVAAPVVEDEAAIPAVAESLSRALADIGVGEDSSLETPAEAEPIVEEEISISSVEIASEPVDAPELISSDQPAELLADAGAEVVEEAPVSSVDNESEPTATPEPLASNDATPGLPARVEPVVAEHVFIAPDVMETMPVAADVAPVIVVDTAITAPVVAEVSIDSEPAPSVAAEIEPVVADDLSPVTAVVLEDTTADAPAVVAHIEPAPPPESPAPKIVSTPKARAKIVEPADRATLIRQRWAETGIRMWNPRLHGTGDATLNIQGRIELLPPEPGETMPRYDKLEFKLLGGQIVCEGVIVEAPVHAGQRSFTRLAEPRGTDRSREPVRERQAALA
ncbi:hypothetical protein JQ594_10295 [Bradyrhizobium manausense]|nr:hypothetical protein [Bradyrhizobium manausense]MBR0686304.1 hypothetical protein [Bradyrhizobium manausense]MBR0722390.1 hypothetical protein [Bradyrhizobium manausense]